MTKKVAWLVVLMFACTILAGCSSQRYTSKERTNYVVSDYVGSKFTETFLTADHPDVQNILALVDQFLQIDMTQDYRSLDYLSLDIFSAPSVRQRREQMQATYVTNALVHQYKGNEVRRILFYLNKGVIYKAVVTADVIVVYTSGGANYLGMKNLKLNEDSKLSVEISLDKTDDGWRVGNTIYSDPVK